ncbi:MAG: hypothetical protein AB2L18_11455 [Anaerolineaceae bacterium]
MMKKESSKKKLSKSMPATSLLLLIAFLIGCTSSAILQETPASATTFTTEPTPTMKSTATQIPPEIDLSLDWKIFEELYGKTSEELKVMAQGSYSDRPVYWIIRNDGGKGVLDYNRMSTYNEIELENSKMVEKYNTHLGLRLDEKGEEVLKQFLLFRSIEDDNLRLIIFIDEEGCIFDLDGALTLIDKSNNNETGFIINVYRQENIPWNEIPNVHWNDIVNGYSRIDFSGDEVISSCNVNNVRDGINN